MTQIVAAVLLGMFVVFMAAISQNLGVIAMAISLVVTPLVSTFTRKIDKKYADLRLSLPPVAKGDCGG